MAAGAPESEIFLSMRIIRYQDTQGRPHYASEQADGSARRIEGDIFGHYTVTEDVVRPLRLLAPVVPTQILCIGLNYRRHAAESGAAIPERPVLFAKGINTLQNPGDPILIPTHLRSSEVDYECELAVVIGKSCKNVREEDALGYVLGYTCCNDVSARDWQLRWGGGQWCRGKFFDTFCPLGPRLVTTDEIPDPERRDHAVVEHRRHDLLRSSPHFFPEREHDSPRRHRDSDRHAARRRHGPKAAPLAQGWR
jgi:2-keto-4-pentenoate hydratase/2-oxohepta-3-ene-1,7-dioic acid hydratase in catechol pathway